MSEKALTASDCNKRFGKNAYRIEKNDDGAYAVDVTKPEVRSAQFALRDISGEGNRVTMSFSSEYPVMVQGEREIISHDPQDIDFTRLEQVGAILKNHDPSQIVGKPIRIWIDDKDKKARLEMEFGTTETAKQAQHEVMVDKTLRGVSVGFMVNRWIYLQDDKTMYRNISGPAWVAVDTEVMEASLTPIPADGSVGVNRSARAEEKTTKQESKMENIEVIEREAREKAEREARERIEKAEADARAKVAAEQRANEERQAALQAERRRASDIYRMCADNGIAIATAEEYISSDKTADQVGREILSDISNRSKTVGAQDVRVTTDGRESFRNAAIDGLRMRSGAKVEKPSEGASVLAGRTLVEIARESLERAGISVPSDKLAMVGRALQGPKLNSALLRDYDHASETISASVSDFPLILANIQNKELLSGFESQIITYDRWCKIGSLNDFKQGRRVRLSEAGELELLAEGANYPIGDFSEKGEPIQLLTFAKKWSITRQAIINDDLDAMTSVPRAFGRAAARKPNELAVKLLLSNPTLADQTKALFHADRGNLANVAVEDVSKLTVDDARKIIGAIVTALYKAKMFKASGESAPATIHGLAPSVILFPATSWEVYRTVLGSTAFPATSSNAGVTNVLQGIADGVIEPLLEEPSFAGNSGVNPYVFANPADAPVVEVAFLQGNRMPFMEETEQTDADGRFWKVRLDAVAAAIDSTGAVKGNVVAGDS